jgi:hypothetical protein
MAANAGLPLSLARRLTSGGTPLKIGVSAVRVRLSPFQKVLRVAGSCGEGPPLVAGDRRVSTKSYLRGAARFWPAVRDRLSPLGASLSRPS